MISPNIYVSQRRYAFELLNDTSFLTAKPVMTHLLRNSHLEKVVTSASINPTEYKRLIGRLIYLTITKSDICYFAQQSSQFMYCPSLSHMNVVTRVLKYIK